MPIDHTHTHTHRPPCTLVAPLRVASARISARGTLVVTINQALNSPGPYIRVPWTKSTPSKRAGTKLVPRWRPSQEDKSPPPTNLPRPWRLLRSDPRQRIESRKRRAYNFQQACRAPKKHTGWYPPRVCTLDFRATIYIAVTSRACKLRRSAPLKPGDLPCIN